MAKEKIYKEDVLNISIEMNISNPHDQKIVNDVLHIIKEYVRQLPSADETPKRSTRKRA